MATSKVTSHFEKNKSYKYQLDITHMKRKKRETKPKGVSGIDNPKTQVHCAKDTERGQTKQKHNPTQKTKKTR
jgi:hypothetical protein